MCAYRVIYLLFYDLNCNIKFINNLTMSVFFIEKKKTKTTSN